jgi:hypothetical protein
MRLKEKGSIALRRYMTKSQILNNDIESGNMKIKEEKMTKFLDNL